MEKFRFKNINNMKSKNSIRIKSQLGMQHFKTWTMMMVGGGGGGGGQGSDHGGKVDVAVVRVVMM
jgi:hypothetical protein